MIRKVRPATAHTSKIAGHILIFPKQGGLRNVSVACNRGALDPLCLESVQGPCIVRRDWAKTFEREILCILAPIAEIQPYPGHPVTLTLGVYRFCSFGR